MAGGGAAGEVPISAGEGNISAREMNSISAGEVEISAGEMNSISAGEMNISTGEEELHCCGERQQRRLVTVRGWS